MAIASREMIELMGRIKRSSLTIRLHKSDPGTAGTTGRLVAAEGGGSYVSGVTVATAGWENPTSANSFQVSNTAAIEFGQASVTGSAATVTHWSAFRGNDFVAEGTLPNTAINNGDRFQINAGTLIFDGNTTG